MIRREEREESVDLRVWSRPIRVGGEDYLFLTAVDIADEKRKAFLERIFLHDILNTASALKGFTNLLGMEGVSLSREDMIQKIGILSEQMIDEINAHRLLMAAESNELVVQVRDLSARRILDGVLEIYDRHETLGSRSIRISGDSEDADLRSDPTLLTRVVGNMTKNALEASVPGDVVTLESRIRGDRIEFRVHNPTYMPEKIRLQVFQRSFSTKGTGRGLGTYSMKYLTENYLRGTVGFTSTESDGTVFVASYPRNWRDAPAPTGKEN
jgi:signal transduction histidine kinase